MSRVQSFLGFLGRLPHWGHIAAVVCLCVPTVAYAQTPGAPSNLTAVSNPDNSIVLQWTPPSTGGAPSGYVVQMGTAPGANDVLNQQIGNVTSYGIVAGSREPGTYYVRVRALNASGVSTASNEVTLVITCTPPTGAPTSVTWRATANAVQLTWVGIAAADDYIAEIGTALGLSDVAVVRSRSGSRTFVSVPLPSAGTYYARVKAARSCGPGPASAEVTIVAVPPTPSTTMVINEFDGFVELKNISNSTLNLGAWRVQTSIGIDQVVDRLATLPFSVNISPGCTYLLAVPGTLPSGVTADQALESPISDGVALVRNDGMIVDAAGRRSSFDLAIVDTPFLEGQVLPSRRDSPGIASFARSGDQDTNNNAADFIPLVTANPQNAAGCLAGLPPGAPAALVAATSGATVSLAWNPPVTGGPVNHYRLEAGTSPGASNAGLFDLGADVTSISFGSVANGAYFVRVRAVNSAGVSAPSNEITVVVCAAGCLTPPGAVTQLMFRVTGPNVLLQWTAPATGPAPIGYVIEAGTGPGLTNIGQFPTGSTSPFVIVTAVPPATYYVRVRAVGAGSLGPPSNEVIVIVQ